MRDEDFPALYRAADRSSLDGQSRFLAATRVRLIGLVVAAIGGAFDLSVASFDSFGFVGLVAFVVALGAEIYTVTAKPDRLWYEGRAAAESVKTLAWRYAVGGEPFPESLPPTEVDSVFLGRVGEVLKDLRDLDLTPILTADQQITVTMREVRSRGFEERKKAYESERVEDQREQVCLERGSEPHMVDLGPRGRTPRRCRRCLEGV
jgi:hypothetical protein